MRKRDYSSDEAYVVWCTKSFIGHIMPIWETDWVLWTGCCGLSPKPLRCVLKDRTMYRVKDSDFRKLVGEWVLKNSSEWRDCFTNTVDSMMEDGIINWGRIFMIFVLCAHIADNVKDYKRSDQLVLRKQIENYFEEKICSWVYENGGWFPCFEDFLLRRPSNTLVRKVMTLPWDELLLGLFWCAAAAVVMGQTVY